MTSTVRPKFIETATEVKQSAATSGKALNLDGDLKLTNNAIFRYNAGFIEFSFDAGTSWYQIGEKLKEWASAKAYYIGDIVIYLDKIYRCDVANSDVSFVDDNWTAIGGGSGGGGSAQTGLLTGGEVTIGADNTSVDVTALVGRIVDDYTDPLNPVVYDVTVDASNVPITNVATAGVTYLYVDKTGAFVQSLTQLSSSQMREHFLLGAVIHTTGGVVNAVNNVTEGVTNGLGLAFLDLQRYQGPKNYEGNVFTPNGTNPLGFNKTAGKILFFGGNYKIDRKNPNISNTTELTNPNFFLTWRNGTGGNWSNLVTQSINPAQYDLNGVLTNVGNNKWKADRVFLVQSGIVVQYAQNIYASRAETVAAIRSEQFTLNPDLSQNALFIGWLLTSGSDTAWLSSNLILSESGMAGASPALVLNSWGVTHVDASMSPYTVLNPRQYVLVDASAGAVTIKLEDVSSGTADRETRIYCTSNSNPVTVTTVGGSQLIGGSTTQKILQENEGFSVVADFSDLKYVITQDNRKESSFKYAQGVWAYFKNYPDIDTANSNLVGGFAVSGNNHYVTVTTGTTAGAYFVSNAVFTEDIIKDINYFSFLYSTASSLGFKAIIQGFNGSTWSDVSSADLPTGDKATYPLQFSLSTYAAFRFKVVQNGTTAGLTCTIARGEWTDDYWKSVQYNGEANVVEAAGNAGQALTAAVTPIPFILTNGNTAWNGSQYTVPESGREIEFSGAVNATTSIGYSINVYKNGVLWRRASTVSTDTTVMVFFFKTRDVEKGDVLELRVASSVTLSNSTVYHYLTITATPIGTAKGIVAAAEVDLSQYQYPQYNIAAQVSGVTVTNFVAIPYKTNDGTIRVRGNGDVTFTSATPKTFSIAGLTTSKSQTFTVSAGNGTSWGRGYFVSTDDLFYMHFAAEQTGAAIWFDVEVDSWPTWATQPTIKPATVIAPVAVANYVSAELTGYAGGASGTTGNIQFANAANSLPDYLEISANKDRVIFKKAVKNVSVQGNYACTTEVNLAPTLELYNSAGILKIDDFDYSAATQTRSKGTTLLFDADVGDYILLKKTTGIGTPINSDATRLIVKCLDIETAHIATNKEEIHKHATYLSSTETEAGWSENRNKKIYKRSIYFPSDVTASNSSFLNVGTGITPVKAANYSGTTWDIYRVTSTGSGTDVVQVYYNATTGYIGTTVVGTYKIGAGTELEFFYTKD